MGILTKLPSSDPRRLLGYGTLPILGNSSSVRVRQVFWHTGGRIQIKTACFKSLYLFYTCPQRWEGEQKQRNPDRGEWQQPGSFPDPSHSVPKAGSHTKKAQSWQCPQLAFGQPAFLSPSSGVWQQHWVTQPPAGDNDHTVGSHTSTTAE